MPPPFNQKAPHGEVPNNMAFPTPTYPHPNHRDHQQPHLQNPMQHWTSRPNGLNPRTPGFIPTGMELQHFHTSSLPNNHPNSYQITSTNNNNHNNNFYPSPLPDPTTFSDFQNYVYRQHIHHLNGITKLQTTSRETDEAVAETREVVKKDLGTLYRLLQQQQKRIDELSLSPLTAAGAAADEGEGECEGGVVEQQTFQAVVEQRVDGASREPGIWDLEVIEPAVMLQRFDPRVVAELYEEQADKIGELVQRLRGFAAQAREGVDGGKLDDEVGCVTNGDGSPLAKGGSGIASRDFADGTLCRINPSEGQNKSMADCKQVESAIQDGGRETSQSSSQLEGTERPATPVEQNNTTIHPSTDTPWIPYALRNLQPTSPPLLQDPNQTFTWDFLFNTLSGLQWSPGFYFNPNPSPSNLLATESYWLLDTPFEPFLPSAPGQPGAKITAFFNDTLPDSEEKGKGDNGRSAAPTEDDYLNTPVFISPDPLNVPADERRYTYFGHYSQKRFSDRIGYDTLRERIPERVLRFWADSLVSPERPGWITRQLMRVFWPRPIYEGPVFAEDAEETGSVGSGSEEVEQGHERVMCALRGYARELAEWEREARERVSLLKPEDLLDSFKMSDAAAQPGLRLWWEYFEFVEFDRGFYDGLVDAQEKREQKKIAAAVKAKKKEVAARKGKEEKINPMPAYVKEDARMEKEGNPAHTLAGNAFSAGKGDCDDRKALNPLTMKYQHPYFPDTNEQPSSPPTPISKAGPKISSSKKPTTTKPKSPLSNDWSNAPRPNQPTPSPRINNSTSIDTSWHPPASPSANKPGTQKPSQHQPDRTTNGIPTQHEMQKKSTTGNHVQPAPSTTGKGAEKPPSHLPNAKALEEARKFQQIATKARERRGGVGRGGPPHLRR
ncbi:hypothetical protein D0867_01629 [Hortaea werneckii]|uniref:DUF6697 domain-containing protein n=1 Tax=Hortaea werneckii TaxID=91943 RepID=A0A3M7AGA5_HORWE|nr:hypothetical protein D0867_01629 [Hortaea werneckii]RMY26594.1 hypothetical protein D0866_10760 [Hortaea werneckii]